MKGFMATVLLTVLLLLTACAAQQPDQIGIRGEVTSITTGNGNIVLLVEGEVEEDTVYDKASVTVNGDTKVVKLKDGKETEADATGIKLFQVVEIVFEGPVAESYPVQGKAKTIRILSE